ncbi:GNAT family N-acetyltransferase [Microvirga soli]|uniref:GNAT family N-acetyltransferase n=1 Tax=Microvirga soli TaxID=1854496 RepID=UPI00191E5014|nr:GNAT family N-acetyltransferase [Microvirga soli]
MTQTPTIAFVDDDSALQKVAVEGIRGFNAALFPDHPQGQDLAIAIHDPETHEPVGGLCGRTAGGWLAINLLFVPDALRGMGLATRLIAMAEDEAKRRGCHAAWLDTLNPQALPLYQRLGYQIFGELKDYPAGNNRFFLQKKLSTIA